MCLACYVLLKKGNRRNSCDFYQSLNGQLIFDMQNIITELAQCLKEEGTEHRKLPDYLDMRNGRFSLKAGFAITSDKPYANPSIILDDSLAPDYHLASSSVFTEFDFGEVMELEKVPLDQRMCDHALEISLHNASLKLLENKNGELLKIENTLTQIIQDDRLNINSFSQNTLTNCSSYNFLGEIEGIQTIAIDPASKKYVEKEDWLEHAPHPVRPNKKKRVAQKEPDRKSKEQLLDEFHILNNLFKIGSQEQEKCVPYKQVLGLVSLDEDADYNDLWDEIMAELSLQSTKARIAKRGKKEKEKLTDEELLKQIETILSEAQEYREDNIKVDIEEEPETQQLNSNVQEKKIEQPVEVKFQFAQPKKQEKKTGKKYQWATQDNSDLSDFYSMLPKQKFAKDYKFQLDQFQKRSILHLQKKESVFVAAHTSAGKTVVAEYGIALAIKHKRKVIYTSPIKALSNQKYRQLSKEFDSVGIVTGDVSMNPHASCVIMTTQILRNNLYRGTEMIRDIEWVIFDEIHYINNPERGMVWEQTIIMLPEHIGLIMLSATVPNCMDFANWVGRTKHRMIYVMKTLHRPVPLEHSLYIFGKLRTIKQPNGNFLDAEYNQLKNHIQNLAHGAEATKEQMREKKKKKIEQKGFYNDNRKEQRLKLMTKNAIDKFIKKITKADLDNAEGKQDFRVLEELIDHCHNKNLLPCVIFTFSKKKINALAEKIFSFDLTNRHEKAKIKQLISHALSSLKTEDQQLEQFMFLTEICMNGYAIHHGDLLPLAKEIVELLFSEGLIKVLFATETFAMGINMPTKTVIFHSIRKVQGSEGAHRFLNSSQYVQMSGRAGRRGLDEKGNVIIIVKDPGNLPNAADMKKMMDHPGQNLQSKFKVTYQIILNLYNSKDISVQEMMRQSFLEDPKFKQYVTNIKKTTELKKQFEELSVYECPYQKLQTRMLIEEYVDIGASLRSGNASRFEEYDFRKNQPPKFALLLGHNNETRLCLLLRIEKGFRPRNLQVMIVNKIYREMEINKQEREKEEKKLGIKKKIVLEFEKELEKAPSKEFNGAVEGRNNEYFYYVYWVRPEEIIEVYSDKLKFRNQLDESKKLYAEIANELLDPPKKLSPITINSKLAQQKLYDAFTTMPCHDCEQKSQHMHQQKKRTYTKDEVKVTASRINKNELGLMGSFEGMVKLLEEFKFVKENALTLKGRVAREVDIYVAQVLVEGVLDPLNFAEVAALMSAFVCDYKPRPGRGVDEINMYSPFSKDDTYTQNLETALQRTHYIVTKIIQQEVKNQAFMNPLPEDQQLFSIINFHLVDTVYRWADGYDFIEAKQDSKAPQGTIVRTIMRLSMLLDNIKNTCRIMGNSELQAKIVLAIESIKRDIVFCPSLYLTA